MKSVWSERDLQNFRANVCSEDNHSDCSDGTCTKTREEIIDCYWDLVVDIEEE